MRGPRLTAGIAAALLASACSKAKHPAAAAAPPPPAAQPVATTEPSPTPTSQAGLRAAIIQSGVTKERATQLFGMTVGTLPGTTAPSGQRDKSDFDGTLAIGYLYQVWDSLTPDQQRTASQLIAPPPPGAGSAHASTGSPSLFTLASYGTAAGDSDAFDYAQLIQDANGTLATFLDVNEVPTNYSVNYGTPDGTEYAHSSYWNPWQLFAVYPDRKCHIIIQNQRFQGLDETAAAAILTHEVVHCYQQRIARTAVVWSSIGWWVKDGEATWAMFAIYPSVQGTIVENKWNLYIFSPKEVYSDRGYDAIGVFGHESDVAGDADVWSKLLPMVAAGEQHQDQDAFAMLIQGREASYYTSWGSSYFLAQGQLPWTMNGPGDPPTAGPAPDAVSVDVGTSEILQPTPQDEAQLWQIDGSADIVVVTLFTGYGRLHDRGFNLDTDLSTSGGLALCLKQGGCRCPDGSPGAALFTKIAHAPVSIGLDGGDVTAQIGVVGVALSDFCKTPDASPPPRSNGSTGGGGSAGFTPNKPPAPPPPEGISRGDTHVTTFDGVYYDLQVKGELTMVRSTKDDFTVQARLVPIVGLRNVTVNQAVATRLARDTVMVAMEQAVPVLRINGKVVTGPLPTLKGGVITRASTELGDAYTLTWPDGTVVHVDQTGNYLALSIIPAKSRRGALEGLMGDYDGSPDNDLIGLQQQHLGVHPSSDDITHSLTDAWRITQAQSLFTYEPGQSTATFTDRNYPAQAIDPSTVTNRASAEAYCKGLQITDQHLLDNCILDLAVTNDFVFGSAYAHAQQVMAARATLAGAPVSAVGPQRVVVMTGEILDSKATPEFTFDGKQGDVIWIHDPDCVDREPQMHPVGFALLGPSGAPIEGFGVGCDFGRRELPATGTYTFRARFQYQHEIARWRIPIRFVRPDRHMSLAYGQIASGNIEERAARDVYAFAGQAGSIVDITGAGCDDGGMIIGLMDPQGHDAGGIGCRSGTRATLTQTGTYHIVVNSLDGGPGQYHFLLRGGPVK